MKRGLPMRETLEIARAGYPFLGDRLFSRFQPPLVGGPGSVVPPTNLPSREQPAGVYGHPRATHPAPTLLG